MSRNIPSSTPKTPKTIILDQLSILHAAPFEEAEQMIEEFQTLKRKKMTNLMDLALQKYSVFTNSIWINVVHPRSGKSTNDVIHLPESKTSVGHGKEREKEEGEGEEEEEREEDKHSQIKIRFMKEDLYLVDFSGCLDYQSSYDMFHMLTYGAVCDLIDGITDEVTWVAGYIPIGDGEVIYYDSSMISPHHLRATNYRVVLNKKGGLEHCYKKIDLDSSKKMIGR